MQTLEDIIVELSRRFAGVQSSELRGRVRVIVPRESMFAALSLLRDEYGFDMLVDVTCVDYLNYREAPDRFGLVYQLTSTDTNQRLSVRVFVGERDPTVASVVPLWEGANWLEREVWDLFGIRFEGHGDLRRIVLPEEFSAHPLRKDYPLQGRGERHNFPVLTRGEA